MNLGKGNKEFDPLKKGTNKKNHDFSHGSQEFKICEERWQCSFCQIEYHIDSYLLFTMLIYDVSCCLIS